MFWKKKAEATVEDIVEKTTVDSKDKEETKMGVVKKVLIGAGLGVAAIGLGIGGKHLLGAMGLGKKGLDSEFSDTEDFTESNDDPEAADFLEL